MEPTLQEKQKTVAEFCGWEEMTHTRSKNWILKNTDIDGTYAIKEASVAQMKFHTDYNWLMEAWVKFRDLETDLSEWEEVGHKTKRDIIVETLAYYPISEAFDRLHEAIVWYKKLNK